MLERYHSGPEPLRGHHWRAPALGTVQTVSLCLIPQPQMTTFYVKEQCHTIGVGALRLAVQTAVSRLQQQESHSLLRHWCCFCWLISIPTTYQCISGTDLFKQLYMLPAEIEVADSIFYLTRLQYTDTRPTSPSTNPITPGAWHDSHWSTNF